MSLPLPNGATIACDSTTCLLPIDVHVMATGGSARSASVIAQVYTKAQYL